MGRVYGETGTVCVEIGVVTIKPLGLVTVTVVRLCVYELRDSVLCLSARAVESRFRSALSPLSDCIMSCFVIRTRLDMSAW